MEYIRNHCLENDLSLDRISAEFNITSSYLSRLVRTSVGCGYKDYVLRLRMEQACIFLKQGMSTTDTCRECGYVNISHFIKTFKQFTGMTPSSYQRDAQSFMQAYFCGNGDFVRSRYDGLGLCMRLEQQRVQQSKQHSRSNSGRCIGHAAVKRANQPVFIHGFKSAHGQGISKTC